MHNRYVMVQQPPPSPAAPGGGDGDALTAGETKSAAASCTVASSHICLQFSNSIPKATSLCLEFRPGNKVGPMDVP